MRVAIEPEFVALQRALDGRFWVERELGRGGMGIVLLARDIALDRFVAIKLLPARLAGDPRARARFVQEARTAAGLSHPNIVSIHLVEERDELVFFVMAYVDGETLRQRVERTGPVSPRLAAKLLQEAAWALAYAHLRGVIHLDVKPDNIMIERDTDRAMLTDFGIALDVRVPARLEGEVMGTVQYMSPEQACGEGSDARSDLYSLGATAFYALTGRAPFEGENAQKIMVQHLTDVAPPLRAIRPAISENLAAIVARCLEKSPFERYASGDELARALDAVRGRDFRAPPLLRSFIRNAQVSTLLLVVVSFAGSAVNSRQDRGLRVAVFMAFIAATITQLVKVARRLLREGYRFDDIRAALFAEAQVQAEEADVVQQRSWTRRINTVWLRLWAGPFGRAFFALAGIGIRERVGGAAISPPSAFRR